MEKRKSGFYWAKLDDEWQVAEWSSKFNRWDVVGWDGSLCDNDFQEINENRIMSPDEWE